MDAANEWTEKQLQALERRMAREYRQAAKEMKAKLERHLADFEREKSQRLKALDDTPEARAEHKAWLESQSARAAWMSQMAADLSQHAVSARQEAFKLVGQAMPGIFTENANRAAYEVDRAAGVDTRFTLMDEGTVKALMQENPRLLPEPTVNIPKDQRWNMRKLTSAVTQGVLQGESIPDIAKRVQTVANMGYHSACGTARLAVTCAENAGRVNSYERARDMGIELRQEWLATLDNRTRHSHRQLDGEKVEVGETFSNGCRFPGDPEGPAEEIYGCRCTLIADVDGVDTSDDWRWGKLGYMTYEEWKNAKSPNKVGSGLGASGGPGSNEEWLKQFEPEVATVKVNGEAVYSEAGTPNSCLFPSSLPNGLRYEDADLEHTHTTPIAGTFSDLDINATVETYCMSHTVRHTLTGTLYSLTRTSEATRELAAQFGNAFKAYYQAVKDEAEYKLWLEEYAPASKPLDDAGRRKVLESIQSLYSDWLAEQSGEYGYAYSVD